MDFSSAEHDEPLVADRDCGTCTLCCKVYRVAVLAKPEGVWCGHCDIGKGCKIHATRPIHCRQFFCLWRMDASIPDDWKPERSKLAISIFPDNGFVYVQVDPGSPQAWRREPYFTGLKRWSESLLPKGRHLIVFVNDKATLIMPTGPVFMGAMSPGEGFMVRERLTGAGKTYEVERVPQSSASQPALGPI